jgi:hypothetical protein
VTLFFDRLRGESLDEPPGRVLSGQLLVHGPVSADRRPVEFPELLIVDAGEPDIVLNTADGRVHRLEVIQPPQPMSLAATVEIAQQLDDWKDIGASWHEAADTCEPVVSKQQVGQLLDRIPLENSLEEVLPDLRQVFFDPESELEFDRLRVPVGRARRISRKASQTLAERSEDWLRMSASGVVPRRIESLVRHEVLDIYENRVAARLADSVRASLMVMLRQLEGIDSLVRHEVVGWWRRRERLAQLWGTTFTDQTLKDRVVRRRDELEELLGQVERLRDGALYRGVPARARVPQPIRVTNLLADDPHYRHVGRLWHEWWRSRGHEETVPDRRDRRLRESEAFAGFVHLLLRRSVLGLGDPTSDSDVAIHGPWGALAVSPESNLGCWTVTGTPVAGGSWSMRVVALPTELVGDSESDTRSALSLVVDAAADKNVVVIYPGTGSDVRALSPAAQTLAHYLPIRDADRRCWIIPVSPLDLESQDRLDQVLRWSAITHNFEGYPFQSDFPDRYTASIDFADWLQPSARRNSIVMVAPARADEFADVARVIEAEARRQETRLGGAGHHDAQELREALQRLRTCSSTFSCLTTCPLCNSTGEFEARQASTFEVRCRTCDSRWGLRHESFDDSRIPYLFVDDDGPDSSVGSERWFGRDQLALPCQSSIRAYGSGVINPRTGRCTEFGSHAATQCDRCREQAPGSGLGAVGLDA